MKIRFKIIYAFIILLVCGAIGIPVHSQNNSSEVQFVIKPQFDYAWNFCEGAAAVVLDGKWGFIDKNGKFIAELQFDYVWDFYQGAAAVKLNGKWGFIDKNGKFIIKLQFEEVGDFYDGAAKVKLNGKYGFIDKEGKFIIEPQFDTAWNFYDGATGVKLNGKWGFIDKNGKFIAKPQFDDVGWVSEGIAGVKLDDKWGFIKNPLSSKEIEKSFDATGNFIGTVKSIEGGSVIVALKDTNKPIYMGQRLCLFSGDSMIILNASFPMLTVVKCNVTSGNIKEIKAGTKVYLYKGAKKGGK